MKENWGQSKLSVFKKKVDFLFPVIDDAGSYTLLKKKS